MIDVGNRFPGRRGSSPFDEDFFTLGAPVGPGQPNRREDVIKVETILGNTGHHDLARTDGPLGYWGERQEKAAKSWQEQNGLKIDGLLNPGGPTITSLKQAAGGLLSGFKPPTPDEVDEHHGRLHLGESGLLNTRPARLTMQVPANAKELDQQTLAFNADSAGALTRSRVDSDVPSIYAKYVKRAGADAHTTVINLVDQINATSGRDRAERVLHAILGQLPADQAKALLGGNPPAKRPLGVRVEELPNDDPAPLFRELALAAFAPAPQPGPGPGPILTGGEEPAPSPKPQPKPAPNPSPIPIPEPRPTPPTPTPEPRPVPKPVPDGPDISVEPPENDGPCRQLAVNYENSRLHYQRASERAQKAGNEANRFSDQLHAKLAERDAVITDALGDAAAKCAVGGVSGGRIPGPWPVKLSAAILGCIRANIEPDKIHQMHEISRLSVEAGEISDQLKEALRLKDQADEEMKEAEREMNEAQGAFSQAGCDKR